MSLKGGSNGREKKSLGFQTPGMLKIIADVHREVDEHRIRNGQRKWIWTLRHKFQVFIPGWIAKSTIGNESKKGPQQNKENTMKLVMLILAFSIAANASIGKVASYPVRHPKKSGHHLKIAAQHVGHVAKKILY